ncbi:MerR family transcriptional regulator [Streptomyces sp. NPDC087440]|uniref:MerR family transcriptional regulator n=1 Tax=Streptomyces sp. NPDC087440 TaxID=3365790 RepID=UPI0038202613
MGAADAELWTIGAFARASRLSPKALRLYDELGLLPPVRVDPVTGYRFYAAGQLERARLVAWLRRLGMPLARIREVCARDAAGAAEQVRAYWAEVEADTAQRRDLAHFLVGQLAREDSVMGTTAPLEMRYAALSDAGRVRESNQDTAYAGARLLAVADGFGAAGAPAGAAAVEVLRRLEPGSGSAGGVVSAGGVLNALEDAVEEARRAIREAAGQRGEEEAGSAGAAGTTLTAMLWTGSQLALVHIGDSRAYLLRDGGLFQITTDHTVVRALVEEGRLTEEEAASHPQRALLARALTTDEQAPAVAAEVRVQDALPGDRYLLCSDGLSAVVPTREIREVLTGVADPDTAVRELVDRANALGGPDNVSCVVADVHLSGVDATVPEADAG